MKTVSALLGLLLLLSWPLRAQDTPPAPPEPDAPENPSSAPPPARPDFRGGPGAGRFGQPPMRGMGFGTWWKNSETVAELQLSDDQVKRIEQAYLNHRLKLVDLRADLDKQELQLGPLLEADQPDEQKVASQIDLITAARGRLEKENALMMLAIRRVLTVEQWKKLQSFEGRRRPAPDRERMGPGAERGLRPRS